MLWFKCSQLPDICNLWQIVVSKLWHCSVWETTSLHILLSLTGPLPSPLCVSDRIAQNRKTIVCPMIDVIDHDNFGYKTQAGDAMRGAFDWEMYYKRIPIPPQLQNNDPSEPFEWVQSFLTHLSFAIRLKLRCHECRDLWHRWPQCESKTFNWVCWRYTESTVYSVLFSACACFLSALPTIIKTHHLHVDVGRGTKIVTFNSTDQIQIHVTWI